ncbi:MAG: RagB/SusD family nutrient uptake outer membrane protein [Bacteroidales bacterium]
MKNLKYIPFIGLTMLLSTTSCQDLLTENPSSYYEKDNFFVSALNAEMSVIGVYDRLAKMEHFGQFEMAMPCSDDTYYIQGVSTDNTRRDIAHYTVKTNNDWIRLNWNSKYATLDRANYTIEGIEGMEDFQAGDEKLKELVAEAKFLRAMTAFDLVKYWGDVPFKTTYSRSYTDAYQPRTNREKIYDQIIEDLTYAKTNLKWSAAANSTERANQGAARALLMRVLLQRAGYSLQLDGSITRPDDATRQSYFEAVIAEWEEFQTNGTHGFFSGDYKTYFANNSYGTLDSRESLFEIAFYTPDGTKEDAGNWGTYNGPLVDAPSIKPTETGKFMGRANAFFRAVPAWMDFFEDKDSRRDVMICDYKYVWDKELYNHKKVVNKNGKDWYPGKWRREWMPIGYKEPNNTDVNFCYLRYADVVLMAAEAYNETNQTATAWTLLNSVRERAGATPIDASNYATLLKSPKVYDLSFIDDSDEAGKFRTALYWERGFELAFEGQRKFDLIRWNILGEALELFNKNAKSDIKKLYPAGQNFIKKQHELFPIPLDEMQINYKLENRNNPGY